MQDVNRFSSETGERGDVMILSAVISLLPLLFLQEPEVYEDLQETVWVFPPQRLLILNISDLYQSQFR